MSNVPIVASAADLPAAIRNAERNVGARAYVARKAAALGHADVIPASWGLTASGPRQTPRKPVVAAGWDPGLHPRGRNGKWIEKFGLLDLFSGANFDKPSARGRAVGVRRDGDHDIVTVELIDPGAGSYSNRKKGDQIDVNTDLLDAAPPAKAKIDGPADSRTKHAPGDTVRIKDTGVEAEVTKVNDDGSIEANAENGPVSLNPGEFDMSRRKAREGDKAPGDPEGEIPLRDDSIQVEPTGAAKYAPGDIIKPKSGNESWEVEGYDPEQGIISARRVSDSSSVAEFDDDAVDMQRRKAREGEKTEGPSKLPSISDKVITSPKVNTPGANQDKLDEASAAQLDTELRDSLAELGIDPDNPDVPAVDGEESSFDENPDLEDTPEIENEDGSVMGPDDVPDIEGDAELDASDEVWDQFALAAVAEGLPDPSEQPDSIQESLYDLIDAEDAEGSVTSMMDVYKSTQTPDAAPEAVDTPVPSLPDVIAAKFISADDFDRLAESTGDADTLRNVLTNLGVEVGQKDEPNLDPTEPAFDPDMEGAPEGGPEMVDDFGPEADYQVSDIRDMLSAFENGEDNPADYQDELPGWVSTARAAGEDDLANKLEAIGQDVPDDVAGLPPEEGTTLDEVLPEATSKKGDPIDLGGTDYTNEELESEFPTVKDLQLELDDAESAGDQEWADILRNEIERRTDPEQGGTPLQPIVPEAFPAPEAPAVDAGDEWAGTVVKNPDAVKNLRLVARSANKAGSPLTEEEANQYLDQALAADTPEGAQKQLAALMTKLKLGGKQRKRYRELLDSAMGNDSGDSAGVSAQATADNLSPDNPLKAKLAEKAAAAAANIAETTNGAEYDPTPDQATLDSENALDMQTAIKQLPGTGQAFTPSPSSGVTGEVFVYPDGSVRYNAGGGQFKKLGKNEADKVKAEWYASAQGAPDAPAEVPSVLKTYADVKVGDQIRLGANWVDVKDRRIDPKSERIILTLVDSDGDEFERDTGGIGSVNVREGASTLPGAPAGGDASAALEAPAAPASKTTWQTLAESASDLQLEGYMKSGNAPAMIKAAQEERDRRKAAQAPEVESVSDMVAEAADFPPAQPGAKVYEHPLGARIYVNPDGSMEAYGKGGKPKKTSATPEKLAAGHGQWTEVGTGNSGGSSLTNFPVAKNDPSVPQAATPVPTAPAPVVDTAASLQKSIDNRRSRLAGIEKDLAGFKQGVTLGPGAQARQSQLYNQRNTLEREISALERKRRKIAPTKAEVLADLNEYDPMDEYPPNISLADAVEKFGAEFNMDPNADSYTAKINGMETSLSRLQVLTLLQGGSGKA